MKLKIKDVARIFNFTTEAIRFYEKEKVLVAERDPENNYRYYGVQHLKVLAKCGLLRSLEFSLKETIDILSNGTIYNISETLKKKEVDLTTEAERLLAICKKISDYRHKIERINTELNKFTVVDSPETLLFLNQHNDDIFNHPETIENSSNLLRVMPFINLSVFVKKNYVLNEHVWSRYHGYSIDPSLQFNENLKSEIFKILPMMTKIPSRKCVYTIQSFNLTKESKLSTITSIKHYIEKNNYIIDGDMIGNQLFVDNEKHLCRKSALGKLYYEYWIPIK